MVNPKRSLPMEANQEYPVAKSVVVLREEFDEWAVLYNPDTADAVGINPVGVAIWKLLDGIHITDIAIEVKPILKRSLIPLQMTWLPSSTDWRKEGLWPKNLRPHPRYISK
jgi:hypothetical protein